MKFSFFFIFFQLFDIFILAVIWMPYEFFNWGRNFPACCANTRADQKNRKICLLSWGGDNLQRRWFFSIGVIATKNSIGHDNRTLNAKTWIYAPCHFEGGLPPCSQFRCPGRAQVGSAFRAVRTSPHRHRSIFSIFVSIFIFFGKKWFFWEPSPIFEKIGFSSFWVGIVSSIFVAEFRSGAKVVSHCISFQ